MNAKNILKPNDLLQPNTIWRINSNAGVLYVVVTGLTVENREDTVHVRELSYTKITRTKYPKSIFLSYYHYVQ